MSHDPLYFFEQTDFSLRFARCAITETSLHIAELKEIFRGDTAAISRLAPPGSQVVCALRPKPRKLYLATAEQAKRHPGMPGVQRFAHQTAVAEQRAAWFTGAQAFDGSLPNQSPWLLSTTSEEGFKQARDAFNEIRLKPARCLDATLSTAGALLSSAPGPTLLLEFGELSSHVLLLNHEGVVAIISVSLNLDRVAAAIQAELDLKFRGSAAKLFFNPECDFTETGPKIAAKIAAVLKAEIAPSLAGRPAPVTLWCAGLPASQHWFGVELASAFGLAPYEPDLSNWSASVGVSFNHPEMEAGISPEWFTFLHFINSQTLEGPAAWQAEWMSVNHPLPSALIQTPASGGKAATTPPVTFSPFAGPVPAAVIVRPKTAAPQSAAPLSSSATAVLAAELSQSTPAAPAAPKPVVMPKKTGATTPVSSVSYRPGPTAKSQAEPNPAAGNKSKWALVATVLLLMLAAGAYYFSSQKAETERIALEKEQTEERLKAEEERARVAQQKAREEAEARKKFEFETTQKLAVAENARLKAEAEAQQQLASRLANARGTLVISTQPAGATVTVGDQPPRTSPATFSFLRIGDYPVTISLPHHETKTLAMEVKENITTEPGLIVLSSLVGALEVISTPAGTTYELRTASADAASTPLRSGKTPARLGELDPGDYHVTFRREGWAPQSQPITVARGGIARAAGTFPTGEVKISSNPSGATVSRSGLELGTTPLTLRQPPGTAQFQISLAGYEPVQLSGQITAATPLELTAQLAVTDRIFGLRELDERPSPVNPKTPDLPTALMLKAGEVVIQLTVNRDGSTSDLKVVRASHPELSRIYLAALAKWKFKPGLLDGQPVRSIVVVPFQITAARE